MMKKLLIGLCILLTLLSTGLVAATNSVYHNVSLQITTTGIPILMLVSPENNSVDKNGDLLLAFQVTDPTYTVTECYLYWNNVLDMTLFEGTVIEAPGTNYFDKYNVLESANNSWQVRCKNDVNNTGDSDKWYLNVAYSSPNVYPLSYPADNSIDADGNFSITYKANDTDLTIVNCSLLLDNVPYDVETPIIQNQNYTVDINGLGDGNYTWQISCTNTKGKTTDSTLFGLRVIIGYSPTQLTLADNGPKTAGQVVTFSSTFDYDANVRLRVCELMNETTHECVTLDGNVSKLSFCESSLSATSPITCDWASTTAGTYSYSGIICDENGVCSDLINNTLTISTAQAGGGGGGGGGGPKEVPKEEEIPSIDSLFTLMANATPQVEQGVTTLIQGQKVSFMVGTTRHVLTVLKVGMDDAQFELRSTPTNFTLAKGEEKSFDLDGDGTSDIKIKLDSILFGTNNKVQLTIERYPILAKPMALTFDNITKWISDNWMVTTGALVLIGFLYYRSTTKNRKKKRRLYF